MIKLPRYRAGPVDLWLSDAFTEFVNGCIEGLGGGAITGGATGATTAFSSLGDSLPAWKQVALSLAGCISAMLGTGVKRFTIWHHNGHPFPNPWRRDCPLTPPQTSTIPDPQ